MNKGIHVDPERVRGAVNLNFEIQDNQSNYGDEWLTQGYLERTFTSINTELDNYNACVSSLMKSLNQYDDIDSNKISESVLNLISGLSSSLASFFQGLPSDTTPEREESSSEDREHHLRYGGSNDNSDNQEQPNQEDTSNDDVDPNEPEEEPIEEPIDEPTEQNEEIINENLIAASIGAIAFQTPITLYSTIGGEGIQTSSETEYGLLGIENQDNTMYYKMIDKKTGKIYYAKIQETTIEEDIQLLHVKENALILNSTDIGSDDNFVKLADSDSYYIVLDKQEINGVSFATILDSNDGNNYYVPISESVEVLPLNQLGEDNPNPEIILEDPDVDITIDGNSPSYSDDDIDISFDESDSLDESNLNSEVLDDSIEVETNDSRGIVSDDSDLEFSDSNYVPEDLINDPKYYEDSEMLDNIK